MIALMKVFEVGFYKLFDCETIRDRTDSIRYMPKGQSCGRYTVQLQKVNGIFAFGIFYRLHIKLLMKISYAITVYSYCRNLSQSKYSISCLSRTILQLSTASLRRDTLFADMSGMFFISHPK